MKSVNALVIAAMPEEMAEFIARLDGYSIACVPTPIGTVAVATKGKTTLTLMTTGIGMTACASALGWALSHYAPHAIISVGSCGGLAADVRVNQVIVGSHYVNAGADGTAFGYVRGQVPGQPEFFTGSENLLDAVGNVAELDDFADTTIRVGQMLSSDAFVTDANVTDTRDAFPLAVSADMETHAAAQVAHAFDVPFLAVRAVSDLCGKPDDQTVSFHAELSTVAASSARVALALLTESGIITNVRTPQGPAQRFDQRCLTHALYLVLALRHEIDPAPSTSIPESVRDELSPYLAKLSPSDTDVILGLVVAGHDLAQHNPSATLTAKDYDIQRAYLAERYAAGQSFAWPPTSQTIIKRFNGYWNDALTATGLVPHRGRARGGLKFTDRDYVFAVRSYYVDAEHAGKQPSFNGYTQWLKDTGKSGSLPSGAAIRQRFGSWRAALAAAAQAPSAR